jgi:hypothetical protein
MTPDSSRSTPGRADSFGFSRSTEASQDIQYDISPKAESVTDAVGESHLNVTKEARPSSPTPLLVKPRSIVLLVEDNSVNMKVCAYPKVGNFAGDDTDSDPYELYEAGQ